MNNDNSTALLIFIRSEVIELQVKQFFEHDYSRSKAFISLLNIKIKTEAQATKLPVFFSNHIHENSFVDKYKRAFQDLFNIGYQRVICVGNDIPQISSNTLLEIEELLQCNDLVSARTKRGGIAFLGLTKEGFDCFDFHKIAWQNSGLLDTLYQELQEKQLNYYLFDQVFLEINTAKDTRFFLEQIEELEMSTFCTSQFLNLCIQRQTLVYQNLELTQDFIQKAEAYRGPPVTM
ncbi:hypothetical protein SAMN05216474_0151 [Lishizhenia tianjinensis]|uniref:DUF2064 domain-containing protein n=1 Tax=Lishizhenia tianjinensis TaxID=477690 RepID=A0A1I6XFC5_9FLAO|nr:DUF2064 domain-containing protein [Lishizhenia tianjinensis]SFT36867.1 hypothetical protein SAMN05216474_0151 [Lishizhenia tianjinensis]